ncbi:hypothetical protein MBAV_003975 [Candidatus Magnetobacterium bavaricum]|uniref:Uncharacterized protein n=1 Tax=Candidatus Magnetobacterium bavaricum TaxID=29290 RepID=A0A0F3GPV2_9BACT|nr:hypothetical protein MBAV_003975 [Candidatus Magnetobacterium bavaricum]
MPVAISPNVAILEEVSIFSCILWDSSSSFLISLMSCATIMVSLRLILSMFSGFHCPSLERLTNTGISSDPAVFIDVNRSLV